MKKRMYRVKNNKGGKGMEEKEVNNKVEEVNEKEQKKEQKNDSNGEMKKKSEKVIIGSTAAAMAIGATPIPFSDALALIPTQASMLVAISKCCNLTISDGFARKLIVSALGIGGSTVVGKTIVSGLLKLIPGIGTVTGGAISATTAGALTYALGEAYLDLCVFMKENQIELSENSDRNNWNFKETVSMLKHYFQKRIAKGFDPSKINNPDEIKYDLRIKGIDQINESDCGVIKVYKEKNLVLLLSFRKEKGSAQVIKINNKGCNDNELEEIFKSLIEKVDTLVIDSQKCKECGFEISSVLLKKLSDINIGII